MSDFSALDIQLISREVIASIDDLDLDLKNRTILTEAATGIFSITPIIAALSGASKVYAVAKSTQYGSMKDINEIIHEWMQYFGIENDRIEVVPKNGFENYAEIDIVTNLGHVRPIDDHMISNLSEKTVISYMCESWEFRKGDIDLSKCRDRNILVAGVNENHPDINCFKEVGLIALKLLIDARISFIGSNIVIISSDGFGIEISKTLSAYSDKIVLENDLKTIDLYGRDEIDILIIADYLYPNEIIGKNGLINSSFLKVEYPNISIVQYCGHNNFDDILREGLKIYPGVPLPPHKMAETLASVSHKSVIRLHSGGLKVGQLLFEAKNNADENALDNDLLQVMM